MSNPTQQNPPQDLLHRLEISTALREADNAVDRIHQILLHYQIENANVKKRVAELEAAAEEYEKQIEDLKKGLIGK